MKKIITTILLAFAIKGLSANWTNYPTGTPSTNDTFLFGVLSTNQFGVLTNAQITAASLTQYINTNFPSPMLTNPISSGVNYTSPAAAGYLSLTLSCTNGYALLTNKTSSFYQFAGAIGSSGTNYETLTMRLSPKDVVLFTNQLNTVTILRSEWHP